jgi:glucokinase
MTPRLAADVGGTKLAVGVVDVTTGRVLHRDVAPTRVAGGGLAVLDQLRRMVADASHRFPEAARRGVGVVVPELVDLHGEIRSSATLDWRTHDVRTVVPGVVVDSDVRAAARAEARFGAGRDLRSYVYVSVGTGVSSTLVIGGLVWAGAHGAAIVAASVVEQHRCDACGSVRAQSPEMRASGAGIEARARAEGWGGDGIDAREIVRRADDGDAAAGAVIDAAGSALGVVIARLVDVVDPEAVVLGGGLGSVHGRYRAACERALRTHIWADVSRAVPLVDAGLGPDSALVGAALLLDQATDACAVELSV